MMKYEQNPNNNIILMTDGYKFSHHKQYPVSWMPPHARPTGGDYQPPILFPGSDGKRGTQVLKILPVPCLNHDDPTRVMKVTFVTDVSTAVAIVTKAEAGEAVDLEWKGEGLEYKGAKKGSIVVSVTPDVCKMLCLPPDFTKFKFVNVDESKLKRGSALNNNFEGGYNVSYFTPRGYKDQFSSLATDANGDHIVFFGLQYFIKEYLVGDVITREKIEAADHFIGRYMADVRVAGPNYAHGFDQTMFPRGDWEAMLSGDHDCSGTPNPELAGKLPIKVEALPEGTLLAPGVCCFKITNTHPRFFWLPNFLETLLVQVWYPITVATQAREFRKTIQAYSILSQRISQFPPEMGKQEFTPENVYEDGLAIHIAQVFDLLDFGYRGVSSHETASLGSAAYYSAGFEGSDTVAGSRMLLNMYNAGNDFTTCFENLHGATSVPAAEHSTITSWADVSPGSDAVLYEAAEYNAFTNMIKQYMSSFCVSLVSDGFNIWNAVACLWPSSDTSNGGESMRAMLKQRLEGGILTLVRPDSGEGVETLPQLLTILLHALPEHWQADMKPLVKPFKDDKLNERYDKVVQQIKIKVMADGQEVKNGNPFRRFVGQQFRVLQGDGVALDSVGDMLASLLANGFCANTVHFGSGGGLLQKVNRDSLSVAFKCCAMYVGDKCFSIGKDPIAGGKKSYPGNPPVIRDAAGVLRNRGKYNEKGEMLEAHPMSNEEFRTGVKGDVLRTVFKDGKMVYDQPFSEVKNNAKITDLEGAVKKALDNLELKTSFLQTMSSKEAISVRLAEAACGSKWMDKHPTKLDKIKESFPTYAETLDKMGLTGMDTTDVLKTIKEKYMCDKKASKRVLEALAEDDPDEAMKARGGKAVVTL